MVHVYKLLLLSLHQLIFMAVQIYDFTHWIQGNILMLLIMIEYLYNSPTTCN